MQCLMEQRRHDLVHRPREVNQVQVHEDEELTMRLRIGVEIVGVVARDHVIVGPGGGYYSFVEAGTWRQLQGRRLP